MEDEEVLSEVLSSSSPLLEMEFNDVVVVNTSGCFGGVVLFINRLRRLLFLLLLLLMFSADSAAADSGL